MTAEIFLDELEVIADAAEGISAIRKKILDLAFRGLLVPQDPADEPASVLLERMTVEQKRLVKEKKIRKQKIPTMTKGDQYLFDIPTGWAWSNLGNVGNIFTGNSMSKIAKIEKYSKVANGRPYIMTPNIGYGCDIESYDTGFVVPFDDVGYRVARPNTPLVCKEGGSAGRKIGYSSQEICFGNKLIALETYAEFSPRFVFYFFQSQVFFSQFTENMTGIIGGISLGAFKSIAIPSPPFAEQQRIVKKVEELMRLANRFEVTQGTRDRTRTKLRDAALVTLDDADKTEVTASWTWLSAHLEDLFTDPADVASLRQTILQLAVRGLLVVQDASDEPASMLLERIVAEKTQLMAEKKIRKQKAVPPIEEDEIPFEVPSGWILSRVADLATKVTDGEHNTPERSDSGHYLLSARNVQNGYIDLTNVDYVPDHEFERIRKRCNPNLGDILLSCSGSVGRVAVVDRDNAYAMVRSAALVKPSRANINPKYLEYALRSPTLQTQIVQRSKKSAQANIFIGQIMLLVVPVPPLAEQHRIVKKVEELMSLCNNLETSLALMKKDRDALAAINW